MATLFSRPQLAADMAQQLMRPNALSEGLRSGLFISGLRRTGKTTFLHHDLIPALEREGALVIYVDLWTDTQVSPAKLVREAIRKALEELKSPGSAILDRLSRINYYSHSRQRGTPSIPAMTRQATSFLLAQGLTEQWSAS